MTTNNKISKSEVMKRAWAIFRSGHAFYSKTFRLALIRAWEIAKANVKAAIQKAKEEAEALAWNPNGVSGLSANPNYGTGSLSSYYAASGYKGD